MNEPVNFLWIKTEILISPFNVNVQLNIPVIRTGHFSIKCETNIFCSSNCLFLKKSKIIYAETHSTRAHYWVVKALKQFWHDGVYMTCQSRLSMWNIFHMFVSTNVWKHWICWQSWVFKYFWYICFRAIIIRSILALEFTKIEIT